jgi:hypothetical protein
MSFDHDFLLLDQDVDGQTEFVRFAGDPRGVRLHDDLIQYMVDTLAWIPTTNPSRRHAHRGLCLCGVTIIDTAGAAVAERVFPAWADLFAAGPPILTRLVTLNSAMSNKLRRPKPHDLSDCLVVTCSSASIVPKSLGAAAIGGIHPAHPVGRRPAAPASSGVMTLAINRLCEARQIIGMQPAPCRRVRPRRLPQAAYRILRLVRTSCRRNGLRTSRFCTRAMSRPPNSADSSSRIAMSFSRMTVGTA